MDEAESDYEYYRRRASEELVKSREAPDPGLAAKHRQLSTLYTSRALQAERRADMNGRTLEGEAGD